MKHPEGRITARTRSDRLLGCSSTSTGAGDAGRNTPTGVRKRREQAQHAWPRPDAAQHWRTGGVTNHCSENPFDLWDLRLASSKLKRPTEPGKPGIHEAPCRPF